MGSSPPDLSDAFFIRFALACRRMCVSPFDLIRVLYSESSVRAAAHNPNGHASGIFQLMPQFMPGVGWTMGHDAFRQLPAEDQVPYLERFFTPWAFRTGIAGQKIPQLISDGHCYTACFLPGRLSALAGAGDAWRSVVLCDRARVLAWAYRDNPALDVDKDGSITAGDLSEHLARVCRGARYDAIVYRLGLAMGQAPEPPPEPPETERELPASDFEIVHPDVPQDREPPEFES